MWLGRWRVHNLVQIVSMVSPLPNYVLVTPGRSQIPRQAEGRPRTSPGILPALTGVQKPWARLPSEDEDPQSLKVLVPSSPLPQLLFHLLTYAHEPTSDPNRSWCFHETCRTHHGPGQGPQERDVGTCLPPSMFLSRAMDSKESTASPWATVLSGAFPPVFYNSGISLRSSKGPPAAVLNAQPSLDWSPGCLV